MYHVAICDDSEADRLTLRDLLLNSNFCVSKVIIHEYEGGNKLLEAMEIIQFSLIFLDLQMDEISGNEAACIIRERDSKVVLVFITGKIEPVSDVFRVTPYRYLIKTAPKEELKKDIISIYAKMISTKDIPQIRATVDKRMIILYPDDILYIEKFNRKSRIHVTRSAAIEYQIEEKGNILSETKLEILYNKLKGYGFGCPHDSYIINFKYVSVLAMDYILLEGVSNKFTVTRSKKKEFRIQKHHFLLEKFGGGE